MQLHRLVCVFASGARPGTVLTISSTVVYVSMIFVAPIFGAIVDISPHRKRLWDYSSCIGVHDSWIFVPW